jgi:DNA-binding SARP family transcriptional activator/EAL domain-containing protein (putative c-di-GMP-specific phosphodiesterase class I)
MATGLSTEGRGTPPRRLVVLGGLRLEGGGGAIPVNLPGRRAELVFAYLAVEHERGVSRYELADALWPDLLPETWAAALRSVVSEVRRFLDDGGLDGHAMIAATGSGWQLRLPPDVSVDLDEARRKLAAARHSLSGEPKEAAIAAQQAAVATSLPFLPSHECEWAEQLRGEITEMHLAALEIAARAHERSGDGRAAIAAAERLVRADPYNEASHRLLITIFGELGDRAGARRAYDACRTLLAEELAVEPSEETGAVFTQALTRRPETAPAANGPELQSTSDLTSRSVLVVEDHDFQRRAAVALLGRLGVGTVHAASGGDSALELLARVPRPDVIICDLDMPGMDGVELIRLIATGNLANAVAIMSGLERGILETVRAVGEGYGLQMLGAVEKPLTAQAVTELLSAYRPALSEDEGGRSPTADELSAGLEDGRITVHLYPIADLATGQIVAAEALPRFRDAATGEETAASLGDVPEDGELTERLYDGLIDLACASARELADAGLSLRVAMRLPHTRLPELHYAGLAGRLAGLAQKRGIAPSGLALTVGEAFAAGAAPAALEVMARLRVKGFGLWLDDAGPNARLDRVPFTAVRLTPALVAAAEASPGGQARLGHAARRARELGLQTVSAGCTDARRVALLVEAGVGLALGPVIARPMPAAAMARWAASWDPVTLVTEDT